MSLSRVGFWVWLVLTPVLAVLYMTVRISPDQALFDYIAWSHLQGDFYYAGVAEQNWPGIMLIHELGIRLFGVHFWTFRAIDFAFMQASALAGFLFLRRAGFASAPWVFLLLYPILYVTAGVWMAGQRDIVAAGMLIAAAALSLAGRQEAESRTRTDLQIFCAGALVAAAVLVRPTYLPFLVGLAVLEAIPFPGEVLRWKPAIRRIFMIVTGFALPVAMIILAGQRIGALDDFYQQTILFNIEAYQVDQPRTRLIRLMGRLVLNSWHWIAALGFLGLGLWLWVKGVMRAQVLVLGLAATILLSYFAQNKGFGYHLGGLLIVFALLATVGIDLLAQWRDTHDASPLRYFSNAALIGVVLLAGAGSLKKLSHFAPSIAQLAEGKFEPYYQGTSRPDWARTTEMVALVRAGSGPEDFVLQWGRNFEIPFLAERRSSLRFVSSPALNVMSASFSGAEAWLEEVRRDLVLKRPSFALIDRLALVPNGSGGFIAQSGASVAERLVFNALRDYMPVMMTDQAVLLRAP